MENQENGTGMKNHQIPIKKWVGCIGECVLVERVYGGGILVGLDHRVDITESRVPQPNFQYGTSILSHTKKLLYMKKNLKKLESYFFLAKIGYPSGFSM